MNQNSYGLSLAIATWQGVLFFFFFFFFGDVFFVFLSFSVSRLWLNTRARVSKSFFFRLLLFLFFFDKYLCKLKLFAMLITFWCS